MIGINSGDFGRVQNASVTEIFGVRVWWLDALYIRQKANIRYNPNDSGLVKRAKCEGGRFAEPAAQVADSIRRGGHGGFGRLPHGQEFISGCASPP